MLYIEYNFAFDRQILAAENGIDRFLSPEYKEDAMIFNLDFDLKDRSPTMVLTEFLEQWNGCNTEQQ